MAGSACAQEEHRSERRPNGRTSARGGALSEWSRRRRAFANAAAQPYAATVQFSAECHGHIAIGAYSPSPRSCHYCASCRPRGRPNASSPTLYRAESLGSFQPHWNISSNGLSQFQFKKCCDAACDWTVASGRVGVRSCSVADSSWRRLARSVGWPRARGASVRAVRAILKAPARVGARCCHCPPRTRAGALWASKRPRLRDAPAPTRRGPGGAGPLGALAELFSGPCAPGARGHDADTLVSPTLRPGQVHFSFLGRPPVRVQDHKTQAKGAREPADRAA
jgi:hypothetical protein